MQMDDGHLETADSIELLQDHFGDIVDKNPDLIFQVGEKLKVKGGDFRIRSIGKKMMVLEGLPGTRIAT